MADDIELVVDHGGTFYKVLGREATGEHGLVVKLEVMTAVGGILSLSGPELEDGRFRSGPEIAGEWRLIQKQKNAEYSERRRRHMAWFYSQKVAS